ELEHSSAGGSFKDNGSQTRARHG
ncbi:hypothetical protein A2U01_0075601, partial [Trifolium medium]|nr:hypothetical protein [Trifolium medium]